MEDTPKTTLTQRRSSISGSAKKLKPEKLGNKETNGPDPEKGSMIKIVAWIMIVVFIGVGTALLATNLLGSEESEDNDTEVAQENEPESFPLADEDDELEPIEDDELIDSGEDTDEALDVTNEDVEEDPTPDSEPEPPVSTTTGDISQFANTDRSIAGSDTNNIIFNRFSFFVEDGVFNYVFENITTTSGSIDPDARLYYEGDDLVFEINNLSRDNVTGSNNTTSRTIFGVSGLTGTETENEGNVSRYKFLLSDRHDSRLVVSPENNEIRVQIDLP
jgi:hypothetical protein